MTHLAKEIPYRNTSIPYGATKIHIEEMLKEAGAKAFRFTETPDSVQGKEMPRLEFMLVVEWKGLEKEFAVRIQPPLLTNKKRSHGKYGSLIQTPDRNASMRLLYWYLKVRLEAVRFGMEDVFEAFMSRVINSLPDGQTVTMSETMREHPEVLEGILPSFEIISNVKALPPTNTIVIEKENDNGEN